MREVVIVGYGRSPIGKLCGSLSKYTCSEISTKLVNAILDKYNINRNDIDEIVVGNVLQAGNGQNIARQISLNLNLDYRVNAYCVNQVCASGMKAIELAYNDIVLSNAKLVIAGGVEIMSNAPHLVKLRENKKLGNNSLEDSIYIDGLTDYKENELMGSITEKINDEYNISREELDELSLESHKRASKYLKNEKYINEVIKIDDVEYDENIRENLSLEKLNSLKPAFKKEGKITPGNASSINDGASFLILADKNYAIENNLNILAHIVSFDTTGIDSSYMGLGPIYSTKNILKKNNLELDDIDFIELNEAFATQVVAYLKEFNIDYDRININGGAISLGHPIGASGARIVTSLLNYLNKDELGLATLCVGGGYGMSVIIKGK